MAYRTLGALRTTLLARLGMGGMGASGGANIPLMNSLLTNGQAQLYRTCDWRHLIDYEDKATGVTQNQYDYPTPCDRDRRVIKVESQVSGQFVQLREGITSAMWSTMDTQGAPQRYERFAQILMYPKADAVYTFRVWYVRDLYPFEDDDDQATLDDEMILLHAVTNGKAHYRQPDAKLYEGQLNTLLASLRGQSFGSNGVYQRTNNAPIEQRPVVVDRDD